MSEAPTDEPAKPSRTFFRIRVTVLLAVLAGVLLYAWRDMRSRALRNDWSRTLDVALIVAVQDVDPEVVALLRERATALEDVLAAELARRRPRSPRPFDLEILEARQVSIVPPPPPAEGIIAAARYAWDLHRFTSAIDDAAGVVRRHDARIYVLARRPTSAGRQMVEGFGEQGGRIGVVEVELDGSMVDLALFVATHELLHTLGASDRYDPTGEPLVPEGLGDPTREPPFPQDTAEIMARHRALGPGRSVPPGSLDELVVGDVTAAEIGWLPAP